MQPAWLLDPFRNIAAALEDTFAAEPTPFPPPIPTLAPAPRCTATRAVTTDRMKLRVEPGLRARVIRTLDEGEDVRVLDCTAVALDDEVWWHVAGKDGQVGWAASEWLVVLNGAP
jgi:uncharacterized protein YgiM (DUF1202 family)